MQQLRIAIVGAGAIAQRNAAEAAQSGVATIAGVFDINSKVAREMARKLGAPVFTSYARISPGGDPNCSPVTDPKITRFSNTRPGFLLWILRTLFGSRSRPSRRSTRPSFPNVLIETPVRALISCR